LVSPIQFRRQPAPYRPLPLRPFQPFPFRFLIGGQDVPVQALRLPDPQAGRTQKDTGMLAEAFVSHDHTPIIAQLVLL
jgi:hypothetical protein